MTRSIRFGWHRTRIPLGRARHRVASVLIAGLLVALLASCATVPPAPPPIRYLTQRPVGQIDDRLDALLQQVAGILPSPDAAVAVGVVAPDGTVTKAIVGSECADDRSLYEYGSITKVLTSTLLAELVRSGDIDLEKSAYDYLPTDVRADQWRSVTIEALATHTAGVPGFPANRRPVGIFLTGRLSDPFAGYERADLEEGIRRTPAQGSGSPWEYSNFGFAVLGYVLSTVTGTPYAELVEKRIFEPLGMSGARIDAWVPGFVAPPLERNGRPARSWTFDEFAPIGAAKGSLADALLFLDAAMHACERSDTLSQAICLAEQPRGIRASETMEMGLAWVRSARNSRTVVWHNGGTGGYSTFLGFSPETGVGIVVLTNVGDFREIDGLAMDFLAP